MPQKNKGVYFDETKWSNPEMLMIDQADNGLKPVRPRMSLLPPCLDLVPYRQGLLIDLAIIESVIHAMMQLN